MASAEGLADLTWPQVGVAVDGRTVLAVPLGATEQHGPHLPLSVDTDVAVALCAGLARAVPGVLVAPPLAYGASGEHAGFPGTLSIGHEALRHVLVELGRSATDTAARVLFVSAHGGNGESVRAAAAQLRAEGRDCSYFEPFWPGEPHAGRAETALALALDPSRVELAAAEPGDTRPLAELMPHLRAGGVRAVSPNGVLGDPRGATAAEGEALLARLIADLVAHVAAWRDPAPIKPGTSDQASAIGHVRSDATEGVPVVAATLERTSDQASAIGHVRSDATRRAAQ